MICSRCKANKAPCLFTPREMGKQYPLCRACVKDYNDRQSGPDKHKGTEMWRKSMKRHFL